MIERWLLEADYSPERTWALAEWCVGIGADEFTVHFLEIEGGSATAVERDLQLLGGFELAPAQREQLTAWKDHPPVRSTPLWRLNHDSLSLLRRVLPRGLLTEPLYQDVGWPEDPILYRDGELLLGIVSHGGEGIVRLTQLEVSQLSTQGFVTRDRPDESWRPWNRGSRPAT